MFDFKVLNIALQFSSKLVKTIITDFNVETCNWDFSYIQSRYITKCNIVHNIH